MTISETAQSLKEQLNGTLSEINGNFLLRIPIDQAKTQDVLLISIENGQKEKMFKFFSIAGPMKNQSEDYLNLLKNNMGLDYGSFSVMVLNESDHLVVCDSVPFEKIRLDEIVKSVLYITKVAHDAGIRIKEGLSPL